ncbi:diguanylate cyclase [bacterium]|nr:diguanylate cyclase [bacterium]
MLKKVLYFIWLVLFCIATFFSLKNANFNSFIDIIENRTFDLRQNILVNSNSKTHNKDIAIIAIDEATYEYILDKYGEWPLPRDVYVKIIDYLQTQNPQIIAFDLMFVKSFKSAPEADEALINSFKKYKNIYTAMNLDNQDKDLREPPILPRTLAVSIENYSDIDFSSLTFTNCRSILEGILNSTDNVGMINVSRAEDGILRKMPLFVKYQENFYSELGLKVAIANKNLNSTDKIDDKNFKIDHKGNLYLGNKKIFLDKDGSAILNWYGGTQTYDYIPMYKLIKVVNGEAKNAGYDFKNKILYFGTTASALFDIKTTPTGRTVPGVEVQATFVNNILDNNFITKADKTFTILTGIILALLIGYFVLGISSAFTASLASVSIYLIYLLISYFAMKHFNIWLEVIYPLILSMTAFISAFIVKYLIKSRDFEQQYKLATTDGLTELYNHRYFQEQMAMLVENSKRYGTEFSLIILDIDFFKKFNDTFGHQAGDTVLRQVAQTLKKNVRATDIVCRYGGEEMSIILPNTGKDEAFTTAEKICQRIASNKVKLSHDKESQVTISLGVSTYPHDGSTPSELISSADKRLYLAKENGRNQVGLEK